MGQLEDMQTFIKIVDSGSISNAAKQLRIAKSAISRRLSELEAKLGTQLLVRTTRQSNLTEAGQRYYAKAVILLDEVAELNNDISSADNSKLKGKLRISIPLSFGLDYLSDPIFAFSREHPEIDLQIDLADRQVDLVEEGYDLSIRIAALADSSLIARKLLDVKTILCASPNYIKLNGMPKGLSELETHTGLLYGQITNNRWQLRNAANKVTAVNPKTSLIANNGDFLKKAVLSDKGIALLPTFIIANELEMGTIIPVLPELLGPPLAAYAIYPQTRHVPIKTRAFIDFLSRCFKDTSL